MKSLPVFLFILLALTLQACNLNATATPAPVAPTETPLPIQPPPTEVPATAAPEMTHRVFPVSSLAMQPYPDVTSKETAAEKRAPFGDSYQINRLERPFSQDMVYLPDLDIADFGLSQDDTWYYVSIRLVGGNPNNPMNILYGVELDMNLDGFGDFIITALPPFEQTWTVENVSIYQDTNGDSAGLSSKKSDTPFSGNGFDKLIYSPAQGIGDDPDLAWARLSPDNSSLIEFAFKKSWAGSVFMYNALADAGLKDVSQLDYVDRFSLLQAGSPDRSNSAYPLKDLFAVDNTCYQAFGFAASGAEPKICPVIVLPTQSVQKAPDNGPGPTPTVDACTALGRPDPGNCPYGWADYPYCVCIPG